MITYDNRSVSTLLDVYLNNGVRLLRRPLQPAFCVRLNRLLARLRLLCELLDVVVRERGAKTFVRWLLLFSVRLDIVLGL